MMLIVARGLIQKMDDARSTSNQHAPVMLMTAIDDGSITQGEKKPFIRGGRDERGR
jgi:hypothetical protein